MRLLFAMVVAGVVTLADPVGKKGVAKPYDLVLTEAWVVFPSAEELMQRKLPLLVRDLGVRELICLDFTTGLVVVWDGKEYGFRMRSGGGSTGPLKIRSRSAWGTKVALSRYDIPKSALAPGKHTVAVRDKFAKSNTLTLFIGKEGT